MIRPNSQLTSSAGRRDPVELVPVSPRIRPAGMLPYLTHADVFEQFESACREIGAGIPSIKPKSPRFTIGFESGSQPNPTVILAWIVQHGPLNVGEQENAAFSA